MHPPITPGRTDRTWMVQWRRVGQSRAGRFPDGCSYPVLGTAAPYTDIIRCQPATIVVLGMAAACCTGMGRVTQPYAPTGHGQDIPGGP